MFVKPLRYCGPKKINGIISIGHNNVGQLWACINRVTYSSKCKEPDQPENKRVEPWPKADPPPPLWRAQCPQDPQPPNYDPYRIKVPNVVVPPLPPSNAKPMLQCTRTKGPCSGKLAPGPEPCPPPPPKPFPWIYVYVAGTFFTIMGLLYKFYLWREEKERSSESKPIWRPRRKIKRPYHDSDLPACVQYLIVGTGAAGWAAYRAIMENDKNAKVFFITREDVMPYVRPPMSKHMWWNQDPPDINKLNFVKDGRRLSMYLAECSDFMDPISFYRKKTGPAVSIATGWCVLRVDADDHVVYVRTMCGEQPVYYERCLLATGSKPKTLDVFKSAPKCVRDKVQTFRTIRDLELAFRRVREAKNVVVIGGGVLGTELAWHLGKMNSLVERPPDQAPVQVTHVFKDRGVLSNVVPEYLSKWAAELLKCENVQILPKTQVYDAFTTPDGRLELTLSNGSSIITDYVLVAVGSEARVEMAEPSFLEQDLINGGFKVNTEMEARTHLYVAGDAASVYSQWKDTRLRFEHYYNAEETGFIAGANMTGHWLPCNVEPYFSLRLGQQLDMEVIGEVGACMPTIGVFKPCDSDEEVEKANTQKAKLEAMEHGAGDRTCFENDKQEYKYKRGILFYIRNETVVGMVFWNIPPVEDRKGVATEILRAKPSYKEISMLAELLGFSNTECTQATADQMKDVVGHVPCINNWRVF